MKLPIGISDFKKIIHENYIFIDKSLLIKDVIDDPAEVILITRPRRFGKTLNMSMLQYFFDVTYQADKNLFADLAITQAGNNYIQHQNQYPIIFLSFKDIKERDWKSTFNKFKIELAKLYKHYDFLLEGNHLKEADKIIYQNIMHETASIEHLQYSLKNLAEYLVRYYGVKPIILIDEYDSPIHAAYLNHHYEETMNFMRGLFSAGLKDNTHLHKGILTGILRISKESLFSGMNNLEVYSLLEIEYGQYFGFTLENVQYLLTLSQKFDQNAQHFSLSDVQKWYNGYSFGNNTIFNPWSIMHYFKKNGLLDIYWGNTADDSLLGSLLVQSDYQTKNKLMKLLQNETVVEMIDKYIVIKDLKRPSALWSFLLMTGYLKVTHTKIQKGETIGELAIPNLEIQYLYTHLVKRWLTDFSNRDIYLKFLTDLVSGDIKSFGRQLENYLLQTFSYFDFPAQALEQTYHVFMLGLVAGLHETHLIKSNRESGYGRYDIMIIPLDHHKKPINDAKRPAILMEFKVSDPKSKNKNFDELLQQALTQMQEKKYQSEIEALGLKHILSIAIVFDGKEVHYQWN